MAQMPFYTGEPTYPGRREEKQPDLLVQPVDALSEEDIANLFYTPTQEPASELDAIIAANLSSDTPFTPSTQRVDEDPETTQMIAELFGDFEAREQEEGGESHWNYQAVNDERSQPESPVKAQTGWNRREAQPGWHTALATEQAVDEDTEIPIFVEIEDFSAPKPTVAIHKENAMTQAAATLAQRHKQRTQENHARGRQIVAKQDQQRKKAEIEAILAEYVGKQQTAKDTPPYIPTPRVPGKRHEYFVVEPSTVDPEGNPRKIIPFVQRRRETQPHEPKNLFDTEVDLVEMAARKAQREKENLAKAETANAEYQRQKQRETYRQETQTRIIMMQRELKMKEKSVRHFRELQSNVAAQIKTLEEKRKKPIKRAARWLASKMSFGRINLFEASEKENRLKQQLARIKTNINKLRSEASSCVGSIRTMQDELHRLEGNAPRYEPTKFFPPQDSFSAAA